MTRIHRENSVLTLTIANGTALTEAFWFGDASGADIAMPAAWTAASIGFKVCATSDGTYLPKYDDTNTLVQITPAEVDKAYNFPTELFASHYVKLWSQDGSAGDENQGAARTIVLMMKS